MTWTYLINFFAHKGLAFEDEALLNDTLRESETMLQVVEENPIVGAEGMARAASSICQKSLFLVKSFRCRRF